MRRIPTVKEDAGCFPSPQRSATLAATRQDFDREATMAYTLTKEIWSAAGLLRRPVVDGDPLDAIRGIIIGSLLSVLLFWMPLAIALTR